MNDDRLSPREHTDMRDLVLAGAQRIKPAGAHRAAFAAAGVALVLVGVITGGALTAAGLFGSGPDVGPVASPSATVTSTTPVATPSALPTAPSATPDIPFGDDCDALLSDATWQAITGGAPAPVSSPSLLSVMPDREASAALVGGLDCAWKVDPGGAAVAALALFPLDTVSATSIDETSQFGCDAYGMCGRAEIQGDMWVVATVYRRDADPYSEPSSGEAATLGAAVDAMLADIATHADADRLGRAAASREGWWTIPDCAAFQDSVTVAAGMADPQPGYPTDNFPDGAVWDVLVGSGVDQWCPWYSYQDDGARLVEIYIQPGVGSPSADLLEAAKPFDADGTVPPQVAGADAAYWISDGQASSSRSTKLLVVSGVNRITVSGDDMEAVAAAVLAILNAS